MARSSQRDVLDKFRWAVQIAGFTKLGFETTTVPGYKLTTNKYAEGGSHLNPRTIIDGNEFKPVILSVGVTSDTSFAKWASGPFDLVQNNSALNESNSIFKIPKGAQQLGFGGAALVKSSNSYPFNYRRKVVIEHTNRLGITEVTYTLYDAFVIEYEPSSDFNAKEDDDVSIAKLTLGYDGFDVRYSQLSGTLQNIVLG